MKQQGGGTLIGFIVGVVIGLTLALGVAVYVTKVPVPFLNRGQSRSAEQDAAEAKKNKDWDPNAPLYGKNPAKPAASASGPVTPEAAAPGVAAPSAGATKPSVTAPAGLATAVIKAPNTAADALGDLIKAKSGGGAVEPFVYFVQLGAFRNAEDAESQRAKLSLAGVETKVSEREQSGRSVFRVRLGPFDRKDDAEKAKERLDAAGNETALVRVQR